MTTVKPLPSLLPNEPKSHHVGGNPPTSFRNPYPSFDDTQHKSVFTVFKSKFIDSKPPFVPVPEDRIGCVPIHKIDWDLVADQTSTYAIKTQSDSQTSSGMRVTWVGHASFLVQLPPPSGSSRGVNILLDPVFSERTSPFTFIGPKRYTPTPCTISELLEHVTIDLICISHNHYDHADVATLTEIVAIQHAKKREPVTVFVGLNNHEWLTKTGLARNEIVELDWWDRREVEVKEAGARCRITCVPTQHVSARWINDRNHGLWCSWAIEEILPDGPTTTTSTNTAPIANKSHTTPPPSTNTPRIGKNLYFAGDTGYRSVPPSLCQDPITITTSHSPFAGISRSSTPPAVNPAAISISPPHPQESTLPCLPTFATLGQHLGPFTISLLPIGLCHPRHFMSGIHANPWDSVRIHRDVRSRKSVGMHFGTVRGGISAAWEDVRTPKVEWRRACEEEGIKFGEGAAEEWEGGVLGVGETIVV